MKREEIEIVKNMGQAYFDRLLAIVESKPIMYEIIVDLNNTSKTFIVVSQRKDFIESKFKEERVSFSNYTGDILADGRWELERTPYIEVQSFQLDKVISIKRIEK